MVVVQRRPKQLESGKKYKKDRRKKLQEIGRRPAKTRLGETRNKSIRTRGGNSKTFLLEIDTVNLLDKKSNKHSKVKVVNVLENSANRNFVRRNIITKGTVIETEKGKARIISRPGQEGTLNAELM